MTAAAGGPAASVDEHMVHEALGLMENETPFPWQRAFLERLLSGNIDRALDLPTGLGKTSVMALWLVARAQGAPVPRRLVYVVDRRAVVDQATDVAFRLRAQVERHPALRAALGLGVSSLPISTLRGQHVDNKEWLEDPSLPAIVVGTVDMIGSRLLFEGYGTRLKMRPYHAGLLAVDTLFVLDEAHLVFPFERLIEAVVDRVAAFGLKGEVAGRLVPQPKLLSLSATGLGPKKKTFTLSAEDLAHPVVRKRLRASKRVTIEPRGADAKLEDALARHAWSLSENGAKPVRCIVFCDKRDVAQKTFAAIERIATGGKTVPRPSIDLFVGGRRVRERMNLDVWLKEHGFIAGRRVTPTCPVFVIATSAGEVGVDLDADHMVCDLVAWERMVQRLGRVNRRGDGDARVIVVAEPLAAEVEKARAKEPEKRSHKDRAEIARADRADATRRLLERLPLDGATRDASPAALQALNKVGASDGELAALLTAATTPAPLYPALSRALVDSWAMTSLEEHAGRPEVEPWLRGWVLDDPPQTSVLWRRHLPVRGGGAGVVDAELESFFESAAPHTSELLETESHRVVHWLSARAARVIDAGVEGAERLERTQPIAFVLGASGSVRDRILLGDLAPARDDSEIKRRIEEIDENLRGATLIVDARIGGLRHGLLDDEATDVESTADGKGRWLETGERDRTGAPIPIVRFRIREARAGDRQDLLDHWRERFRFEVNVAADEEAASVLVVDKWRDDSTNEEDRSAGRHQLLDSHQEWAAERARSLAKRLGLPADYAEMLELAARLHDEGKRAQRWQRAFNARRDGVYAKTLGPINFALLDGYRHELGSLRTAADDPRVCALPAELRELLLHIIAAHHGYGRPLISTRGCEDAPPSQIRERAREVAMRFVRLQRRWGPWGLAWWEALLRAADQQASRDNEALDVVAEKGDP